MNAPTRRDKVELGGDDSIGWHSAYMRGGDELVVEWLEYRDPAPYDHATRLVFDAGQQAALRKALGGAELSLPAALVGFTTYWAVKAYADAHALAYRPEVDFQP